MLGRHASNLLGSLDPPELDHPIAGGGYGLGDEARGLALHLGPDNGSVPLLAYACDEEPGENLEN
jgi:hypothetical protein